MVAATLAVARSTEGEANRSRYFFDVWAKKRAGALVAEYSCRGSDQLETVAGIIAGLNPAKVWRVNITPYKSRRSTDQNSRLWALYQAISQETGYAAAEVHEICKAKFGEPKVIEIGGQQVTQYTTHDKDVEWFGRFLDQVEAWSAQELGVALG